MDKTHFRTLTAAVGVSILVSGAAFPRLVVAQIGHIHPKTESAPASQTVDSAQITGMADHPMSGPMDTNMMKHMALSPTRPATRADSLKAYHVAIELRQAISKYRDTTAAVADGYKMFAPNIKNQKVYHFTNGGHGFKEVFRFDPTQPTSLLYQQRSDGKLHLIGAMYTLPRRASLEKLNDRVPLSIAHWHQHVNWCVPKAGNMARWAETKNGVPVFGPESPIANKAECDAVNGNFYPHLLGWMIHANVFAGDDLGTIWGDDHNSPAEPHKHSQ